MDRRSFLGQLVGGIATAAAVRTWPFRVYSFPSEPKGFHFDLIKCDDMISDWRNIPVTLATESEFESFPRYRFTVQGIREIKKQLTGRCVLPGDYLDTLMNR